MSKRKPIYPPTWLLLTIVIQIALHFAVPGRALVGFPWSLAGALPIAGGLALAVC